MSFCRNCGAVINTETGMCANCVSNIEPEVSTRNHCSVFAIIVFNISIIALLINAFFTYLNFTLDITFLYVWLLYVVAGLLANFVCLALSIVAVCITVTKKQRGKGLAIASLVLNALSFCMALSIVFYLQIIKLLA